MNVRTHAHTQALTNLFSIARKPTLRSEVNRAVYLRHSTRRAASTALAGGVICVHPARAQRGPVTRHTASRRPPRVRLVTNTKGHVYDGSWLRRVPDTTGPWCAGSGCDVSRIRRVPGAPCLVAMCPGYDGSLVRRVLVATCPGYDGSLVRRVLVATCPGYNGSLVRLCLVATCPGYDGSLVRRVWLRCVPDTTGPWCDGSGCDVSRIRRVPGTPGVVAMCPGYDGSLVRRVWLRCVPDTTGPWCAVSGCDVSRIRWVPGAPGPGCDVSRIRRFPVEPGPCCDVSRIRRVPGAPGPGCDVSRIRRVPGAPGPSCDGSRYVEMACSLYIECHISIVRNKYII